MFSIVLSLCDWLVQHVLDCYFVTFLLGQEQEQNQFTKAVGWFSSSDLLAAIVETMSELQDVIMKARK